MPSASLTKSEFLAGLQCHKLLWLKRHEPLARELQPDIVLQDLFDQGEQVGVLAREQLGRGTLIPYTGDRAERVRLTAEAMASGAAAIFEGAFEADGVFVATDLLVRGTDGWHLIEVKSASEKKPEHVDDAGVQAHVLARSGVRPARIFIQHLNKAFLHPDVGELFDRTEVTGDVAGQLIDVSDEASRQTAMLDGPLPDVKIGPHCLEPRQCPFSERCWPQGDRHISNLFNVGPKKAVAWMAQGVHSIDDLPPTAKLSPPALRQRRSLASGALIVEPTLARDLAPFGVEPLGFLDFETIARAVPVWPAMSPWGQAAAQFSYHESRGGGTYRHEEFLAQGPQDARPELAARLIEATHRARGVVVYSAFEKTQIGKLAEAVPALASELQALRDKLIDLLPVIRNNVYHPHFRGSFSIKYVLPALVPELTYNDLVIVNGLVASVTIARLLFVADRIPQDERERVRRDLLEYCKMDTWATVKLLERLRALAEA